jgi:NAD(P)H-flavin reductase
VIRWIVLSGFSFVRAIRYEIFLLQHIAAAGILLWLVHVHVPSYAAYNVWLAIGFVAFDRIGRIVWLFGRNLHLFRRKRSERWRLSVGYRARLTALSGDYVHVRVKDIDFYWRPGQHVYICIPSLGFTDYHAFSIANDPASRDVEDASVINLYIKAHSGFTRRLRREAENPRKSATSGSLRSFISGPWGFPPSLDTNETVIFVGASTGATFTVPLFQSLSNKPLCVRRIHFYWIVRPATQLTWFTPQILAAAEAASKNGVDIRIVLYITGSTNPPAPSSSAKTMCCPLCHGALLYYLSPSERPPCSSSSASSVSAHDATDAEKRLSPHHRSITSASSTICPCNIPFVTVSACGRPSFEALILSPVEQALGETAIVACGGPGFTGDLRNYVARLSDERAVYKGTGAQGLSLYTETFGW